MRISEVTPETVKLHARVETDDEDAVIEGVYMPAALAHLLGFTGMTEEEADRRPDMTLAYLALVAHMIDHRGLLEDGGQMSRVAEAVIGKYDGNLLGRESDG